jgi:hypothetical protein
MLHPGVGEPSASTHWDSMDRPYTFNGGFGETAIP